MSYKAILPEHAQIELSSTVAAEEKDINLSQFNIVAESLDKTKRAGVYYYLFKFASASIAFFILVARIFSQYMLPLHLFTSIASIYRSRNNIKEASLISNINFNLWTKVVLNFILAILSVLACVVLFGVTVRFLPYVTSVVYGLKFISKTGLCLLYLYRYFSSEPGSQRRAECRGRAEKYALSALVSLFSMVTCVLLSIADVFTGGISTYCILGAGLALNAFNTGYISRLEFFNKKSTLPDEIEHIELIEEQKEKKNFLIKLIDKKIKVLNGDIENRKKFRERSQDFNRNFFSQSWNFIKITVLNLLPHPQSQKKTFLDQLKNHLQKGEPICLEQIKNKKRAQFFNKILRSSKFLYLRFSPQSHQNKMRFLRKIDNFLDSNPYFNSLFQVSKKESQPLNSIKELMSFLEKNPAFKKDIFSSYTQNQGELKLLLQTALNIENEDNQQITRSSNTSSEISTTMTTLTEQLNLPPNQIQDMVQNMDNGNNSPSRSSDISPSSPITSKKFDYDEDILIQSMKSIEDERARKKFLIQLINKKINALMDETREKSKSNDVSFKKLDFLVQLKNWLDDNSILFKVTIDSSTHTSPAIKNMQNLMDFLDKHPDFKKDIFSSRKKIISNTALLVKATALHLDLDTSKIHQCHKPGHTEGKFYFKDIENSISRIKDDRERADFLIKLIDKKIASLSEKITKPKESKGLLDLLDEIINQEKKHRDKIHILKWLQEWLKEGVKPKILETPYGEISEPIHNMKELILFLQKPKQSQYKCNIFGSSFESLGETDGLVRAFAKHLDMCKKKEVLNINNTSENHSFETPQPAFQQLQAY